MGCTSSTRTSDEYKAPTDHELHLEKSKSTSPAGSIARGSGKLSSKGSSKGSGKNGEVRLSMTESKIHQALLKKKMELAVSDKPITFEKILLKFDKLRTVTGYIKDMFNEVAKDGQLDHVGTIFALLTSHT